MILSTLCYIEKDNQYLMLHRAKKKNDMNKDKWIGIGGKFEQNESPEECVIREVKEEFGIDVKIIKKMYEEYSELFKQKTIYYLCEYVSGKFGTGTGPEFSNDPKYISSGKYIPEIIKREDIEKIPLMPPEIKEKFVKDIKNKII